MRDVFQTHVNLEYYETLLEYKSLEEVTTWSRYRRGLYS